MRISKVRGIALGETELKIDRSVQCVSSPNIFDIIDIISFYFRIQKETAVTATTATSSTARAPTSTFSNLEKPLDI